MRMPYLVGLLLLVIGFSFPTLAQAGSDEPDYTRSGLYLTFSATKSVEAFDKQDDQLDGLYQPNHQDFGCLFPDDEDEDCAFGGRADLGEQTPATFLNNHNVTSDFTDTMGLGGALGYRLDRNFAVELRGDRYKGFRAQGLEFAQVEANHDRRPRFCDRSDNCEDAFNHTQLPRDGHELQGWSAMAQGKAFYPVMGDRLQPFAMVGAGALTARLSGPSAAGTTHTVFMGRVGLGMDFYVTENIVLGTEASRNIPSGALRDFDFYSIATNLTYRF